MGQLHGFYTIAEDAEIYRKSKPKHSNPVIELRSEEQILTIDDADIVRRDSNASLQRYDVFILYADEDFEFALKIIEFAESRGLKV